jgi:hypothetical protein
MSIGTSDYGPCHLELGQDVPVRVTEGIVRADADYGDAWADGGKEFRCRGS